MKDSEKLETDYWKLIKDDAVWAEGWEWTSTDQSKSLLVRSLDVFKLNSTVKSWRYKWVQKALYYAQFLINYALSFVAFIALCLLMSIFYAVIIWDEKQIDKAMMEMETKMGYANRASKKLEYETHVDSLRNLLVNIEELF